MMDLNSIYSPKRLGIDATQDTRTAYQRDFDRIIFSSGFRRLQNKTQVFPLPGSVFVHNRLTHSLEVASVGRSLGSLVGEFIYKKEKEKLNKESRQFYKHNLYNVISSACLCHDIGNPAFGHSGEDAIASFFEKNESNFKSKFSEKEWTDFIYFEGNANAIRILTQQQSGKSEGGMGLTYATLVSIAKYPCESVARTKGILHRKKFGFFQSEKENFQKIASETQMIQENDKPLIYKRHPFVWLVEAADDICYNIIDLEDSHRLGIIDHDKCVNLLVDLIASLDAKGIDKVKNRLETISDKNEKISYLRAKSIGQLIQNSAKAYENNFELILNGDLDKSLLKLIQEGNNSANEILDKIEEFSVENIYNHHSVVEIENAGFNVMYELLSHFVSPILKQKKSKSEEKAIKLIPNQFLYEDGTDYQKVLGVLDYVSGMTDNYATELYRRIKGIEIGMRR
ncbi:dGTPase [Moheibacter sediminis]|uniref:dGTPase n=2 Tax=Moheibacter sediminis TaxID=1434700 RepID=A0A1W1ZXC8_9FLAO|nr:dGTPase [Moheibacter sediminis]